MESKFILNEYWNKIPLREANYTEFLAAFKPLLNKLEEIESQKKSLRDIDLYLYLKNNPLLMQKGNEKESRQFLAIISRWVAREIYQVLFGFLFLCKYDFEGFMHAYETLSLQFPSKDLSLNGMGECIIESSAVSRCIRQVYKSLFEDCTEGEFRKLSVTDPAKFEEKKSNLKQTNYEEINAFVESLLVQEGRSNKDGIEFEYFCEHIFPKIQANLLKLN